MLQFSHIAWEGVVLESHDGIPSKSGRAELISLGVACKEILRQREYVGLAFSQRWEPDREGLKAIKQICTKGLLLDIIFQRSICRSNDANIGMDGSRSANSLEGVLL
jgi:hypothetical protein